jgi:hypothetical protein
VIVYSHNNHFVFSLIQVLHKILPPLVIVIAFARARLYAAVMLCLITLLWTISTYTPFYDEWLRAVLTEHEVGYTGTGHSSISWFVAFTMIPILSVILLSVAPAKVINRRLMFLALGLLLLIALNELSKLGLDLTAPKRQG